MLEYQELDIGKNEIRLLTILGLTSQNREPGSGSTGTHQQDLVECVMEHVSLDDYTAEYSNFLQSDGSGRSAVSRAILWEQFTARKGTSQLMAAFLSREMEGKFPGMANEPLNSKGNYGENRNRWLWGDFAALSYVWGDPTITSPIVVNGKKVDVTKNLEEALRNIHRMDSMSNYSRRLWVDALCINQMDIEERNKQVKRMAFIYAEAGIVYAWVGGNIENGERIVELVNKMIEVMVTSPEALRDFQKDLLHNFDDSTWKATLELINRPYWNRLWIIQEILLANTSIILCFGQQECSLSWWFAAYYYIYDEIMPLSMSKIYEIFNADSTSKTLGSLQSFLKSATNLGRLMGLHRFKYSDSGWPNLMTLLDVGRYAKQTDNRDKIYALLGLAGTEIRKLVDPDYNAPALEVYRNFSRSVIQATRKLDIIFQGASGSMVYERNWTWIWRNFFKFLVFISGSGDVFRNKDPPSWVPDWSLPIQDISTLAFQDGKRFCAAKDTEHSYQVCSDENHLICKGVRIDLVDGLGCPVGLRHHSWHPIVPSTTDCTSQNVYGDLEGTRTALLEALTLGDFGDSENSIISLFFGALPWFNGAAVNNPTDLPFYPLIDRFQQCNQHLTIAGNRLANYFDTGSETFNTLPDNEELQAVLSRLVVLFRERRLMTTNKGYLGFGSRYMGSGDIIFVLMGCNVPVVLRECGKGMYQVVGECYVYGIMKGEVIEGLERGEYQLEDVTLC